MHITESAVIHEGLVFTGKRHSDAIRVAVETTGIKPVRGTQGFLTDTGLFVTREEAAKIAFDSGQIKTEKSVLYSEDLW